MTGIGHNPILDTIVKAFELVCNATGLSWSRYRCLVAPGITEAGIGVDDETLFPPADSSAEELAERIVAAMEEVND